MILVSVLINITLPVKILTQILMKYRVVLLKVQNLVHYYPLYNITNYLPMFI